MDIHAPGTKEERDDIIAMQEKMKSALFFAMLNNRKCDCPCNTGDKEYSFADHLTDLLRHPEFRAYIFTMSNMLQKYPELASSFVNAACIRLSATNWSAIENNAGNINKHFNKLESIL